jgi:AraC family transcriptional regulator
MRGGTPMKNGALVKRSVGPQVTVEAELRTAVMTAQVLRYDLSAPVDMLMREEPAYRLDLSLTPRPKNARACYRNRWNPHRFERLGKMFLVPPGETLHARSDSGSLQTSVVCHFGADTLSDWMAPNSEWNDRCLEASLDIQNDNVRSLLVRLAQEVRYPGLASVELSELIAAQMVIEIGRYFSRLGDIPISGGLAPWRLRLIDDYLRDASAPPALAELARLCKLSVRQLTRGFRVSRGCSIGDYLAIHRIDHAKALLGAGQSVKEVAYALGFSSPSSFCYAFRRTTGVTPREFLKRSARLL